MRISELVNRRSSLIDMGATGSANARSRRTVPQSTGRASGTRHFRTEPRAQPEFPGEPGGVSPRILCFCQIRTPRTLPGPKHTRSCDRYGLTLFEVLLALVIFIGAMAAIGQLVSNGVRAALQARFQTQAAMMCEAKLGEVVAGIVPLTASQAIYPDDPNWSWNLALAAAPVPGLMRVEVTVQREGSNSKGRTVFSMARYVRDPQLYVAAQAEAERIEQEKAEAAE